MPLSISLMITLSLLGGCFMKPPVNMNLVKEGLALLAEYPEEVEFDTNLEAAIARGLVLEPAEVTYIDYVDGFLGPQEDGSYRIRPPVEPGSRFSYPTDLIEGETEEKIRFAPDVHFYILQAYYKKALEVYLLQTLRLDLYEKKLADYGFDFGKVDHENMSSLEKLSNLDLKHMYLCIPMRIEQLSLEDAAVLKHLYEENGAEITEEAIEFIKRTYPEVIKERTPYMKTPCGLSWDPQSVVISFKVPDISEYYEDEEWISERQKMMWNPEQFLLDNLPRYWEEMQPLLDVPLTLVIERQRGHYKYTVTDVIRSGANLYQPNEY